MLVSQVLRFRRRLEESREITEFGKQSAEISDRLSGQTVRTVVTQRNGGHELELGGQRDPLLALQRETQINEIISPETAGALEGACWGGV